MVCIYHESPRFAVCLPIHMGWWPRLTMSGITARLIRLLVKTWQLWSRQQRKRRLVGEVVNHVGIYWSKATEGFSAFKLGLVIFGKFSMSEFQNEIDECDMTDGLYQFVCVAVSTARSTAESFRCGKSQKPAHMWRLKGPSRLVCVLLRTGCLVIIMQTMSDVIKDQSVMTNLDINFISCVFVRLHLRYPESYWYAMLWKQVFQCLLSTI